jgi:DNA gyrase/topoisomerase IV subunit B
MDLFKIMQKFEEQKALKDAFKPKKPTEVEGLLTATEENVFLHIVEGDSAKGLANALGRKDKAYITSGGKLPNLLDAKPSDIAKNKKIKPIIEALGYDFSKKPEEQQLNFEYIVSTVDADPDGVHIQTLLLTFIYSTLPHLIDEGRVLQLETPMFTLRDSDNKVIDFAWDFKDKKD